MRITIFTALATLLLTASLSPSLADDDDRHELLYEQRQRGSILPLGDILRRLEPRIGREILEVEIDEDDDRLIYEIYYVDERGRRRDVEVDAATGRVLDWDEDDDDDDDD